MRMKAAKTIKTMRMKAAIIEVMTTMTIKTMRMTAAIVEVDDDQDNDGEGGNLKSQRRR
jgi:plastocyanin domain-containing protein